MATGGISRLGLDAGRLVMVPIAAGVLVLDVLALLSHGGIGLPRLIGAILTCAFYVLIIWNYLRRGPALATTGSVAARAIAVLATMTPTVLPLLHGAPPGPARQLAADALLIAGSVWSVWSLRSLGKNLSVFAQARQVAERGPYRFVRHPLYTGEIISTLGVMLAAGTAAAAAVWLALVVMQVSRAMTEEKVLLAALPGYGDYRARTAALLPGLTWIRRAYQSAPAAE